MIVQPLQYITSFVFILFARAQTPWPGALPLAIRSPHFNAWLPSPGPPSNWPLYWTGRVLGWSGFIRIDGVAWEWLGSNGNRSTTLVKTEITPTSTILTLAAGPMDLEVTFLSPIEPTDLVRQSFPFMYMYLTAKATDGASHSVQVYSDISAEWVSGDSANLVTWNTTSDSDLVYHQAQRASPASMQEISDQAEDATVYYAMANSLNMTWQTGVGVDLKGQFGGNLTSGRLSNTEDKNSRAIQDNWPVFALSMDLGTTSEISNPVVWALGLVRDPTIRYVAGDGSTQLRSSYFWTQYKTIGDAISAFVKDFPNARQRALDLDQRITSDALSISQDYVDLVSLSARQTVGSIDITTSRGTNGELNASDIMMFMKSVGDTTRRVNPTEFMFAALPAYLYLNASWAGFLLKPSLQQQAVSTPTSAYAIPDLGWLYPDAPGNYSTAGTDQHEALSIESSGNMIVMVLAHAKASGDRSLISRYYPPLKSWANYLAANALNQTKFITSDGQNNPNLAIKGIIGIRAMSEISQMVGQTDDASRFKDQASAMLQDWKDRAIQLSHVTSIYGQSASWGLIYNLFSDRLLGLDFIPQKIYSDQTDFYTTQIPAVGTYGIIYDSSVPNQAKSHWTMLTSATTTDNSTRDDFVSMVHSRARLNNSRFPTDYNAVSGEAIGVGGKSSPAQGAMFAFLALQLPERSIQVPVPSDGGVGRNPKPSIGAIVGATVAGVAVIGLTGLCLLLWKRRKASTPAPSLYTHSPNSDISGAGDIHRPYKGYIHSWHSTLAPSDSLTLNAFQKRLGSGLPDHARSHSSSISEPSNTDESFTPPICAPSELSHDGRPTLRGSKKWTLPPPQLGPAVSDATASIAPSGAAPSQVDVTRWLSREVEALLRETQA